jgi:hypothetical protein
MPRTVTFLDSYTEEDWSNVLGGPLIPCNVLDEGEEGTVQVLQRRVIDPSQSGAYKLRAWRYDSQLVLRRW